MPTFVNSLPRTPSNLNGNLNGGLNKKVEFSSFFAYFGLDPALRLHKTFEGPMIILRKFNIQVIIYLNDFLILGRTLKDVIMRRYTMIFLFQNLNFVINIKKVNSAKYMEILGMVIDSVGMTLSMQNS